MMPLDLDRALKAVEIFCESRIPSKYRDEVRIECERRGNAIPIIERRPPWNPDVVGPDWSSLKVAQLRFDGNASSWSLYCRDRNERWWPYDGIGPTASVDPLLAEIDADPTGIFWG